MQLNAKTRLAPLHRFARVVAFLAATSTLSVQASAAGDTTWLDVEGRIQYGFYTEDARSLTDLADQLARDRDASQPLQLYYAGLANYRLALVLATRNKDQAREAIERCVASLDAMLKADRESAPGFALQSACLRTMSILKPWSPLASSKSTGQMERALKLAPRDPRVLLLEALDNGEDGKIDEQSLVTLKKAAAAFESERQGLDRTPGWGAADAYTHLGRGYLERGDVLKARDALERALLIAPDFVRARRLLLQITSG
jgi:tetratricopeptide (TPR) repeat protein